MSTLKEITETSYILYSDNGDKLGLLFDYTQLENKSGYELIFSDGNKTSFDTLGELETLLGSTITIEKTEIVIDNNNSTKMLDDYPINDTDNVYDVDNIENGIPSFKKSKRSQKRFYPGWWIIKSPKGEYQPRLTISLDIYKEQSSTNTIHGPYKTFMEVTYNINELQKED